tara:strand:- start:75 stop:428 length:354 start_codon:yes stop_codon:yes gene_type:complete
MNIISSVLVLNVTAKGIVVRCESPCTEGSTLCFLSESRASSLGISIPTDAKTTWLGGPKAIREGDDAWSTYQTDNTQQVHANLVPYPLTMKGEPWIVQDKDEGTAAEKQWQGLKLVV